MGKTAAVGRSPASTPGGGTQYKVVTVAELDRDIFAELSRLGAARQNDGGGYTITDTHAARSQSILPKVLDRLGKDGWLLCAVNKMECYIFQALPAGRRAEYKVLSPADMDKLALVRLEAAGVAGFAGVDQGRPVMQILDPSRARIQEVLPAVMGAIAEEGWQLAAINGPQLYIFARHS